MISLRPPLITEHHSVSSLNDLAREASPSSRYLRPARDEDTAYTVGGNCSRVDGDKRTDNIETRSYATDASVDPTEARRAAGIRGERYSGPNPLRADARERPLESRGRRSPSAEVIRDLRLAAVERPAERRALINPITKIQARPALGEQPHHVRVAVLGRKSEGGVPALGVSGR